MKVYFNGLSTEEFCSLYAFMKAFAKAVQTSVYPRTRSIFFFQYFLRITRSEDDIQYNGFYNNCILLHARQTTE